MKFDKKEAAGQPLPFSAPKNPQWVMLAALLLSYAAGYEYVDRCLGFGVASEYSAWRAGVLVFVALYTVVVELAAWAGDRKPSRTAAAWWCCWLVQSLAMARWSLHTDDLGFWQVVAWHCTAIYYVLARNDLLAAGRTSCLVLLDGVAGMFAIPFGNFLLRTQLLWQALHRWWANHAGRKGRTLETAVSITAALLLGGAACVAGTEIGRRVHPHTLRRFYTVCALLVGGGTFLVGAAPAWGGILGMMLVQGVLEVWLLHADQRLNALISSDQRATLISVDSMAYSILMIPASPFVGAVGDLFGQAGAGLALLGVLTAASGAAVLAKRRS